MNIEMNIDLITKIGGYFSPFFVASIAAGLAFFGWRSLESEIALSFRKRNLKKIELNNHRVFESSKERGKPKLLEISAIAIVGTATSTHDGNFAVSGTEPLNIKLSLFTIHV